MSLILLTALYEGDRVSFAKGLYKMIYDFVKAVRILYCEYWVNKSLALRVSLKNVV